MLVDVSIWNTTHRKPCGFLCFLDDHIELGMGWGGVEITPNFGRRLDVEKGRVPK